MKENLLLRDAVAHIINRMANDDGHKDLDDVIEDDGDAAPGKRFPVALEIGIQRFEASHHAEDSLNRKN